MTPQQSTRLLYIWTAVLLSVIAVILVSCKSTRQATTIRVVDDSLYRHIKDSFKLVIKDRDEQHQKAIDELLTSRILFATTPCPPQVNIDSACSKDSMIKIIRAQEAFIASMKNTVEYYKDGSYKATGQIASISNELKSTFLELDQVAERYSDLMAEHEDTLIAIRHEREQTAKKSETKPGGIFQAWWLFPAGLLTGLFLAYRRKIFSTFK